jgi:hypothetical protein
MTIVQANFSTGRHQLPWFPFGDGSHSKPLSDIEPDPHGAPQSAFIPFFTFAPRPPAPPVFLINNLAIYMDRWQMAVDLWPGFKAR